MAMYSCRKDEYGVGEFMRRCLTKVCHKVSSRVSCARREHVLAKQLSAVGGRNPTIWRSNSEDMC